MSINKVVYGNDTLIDLTEDTVAPENLLSGATAHNAAGNPITGIAKPESLLKDTVGWTGKNLIPLPYEFGNQQTQGGITAKTNADGSITFNGTVTASISFRLKGRSIHDNNYFLVKPGKYIFSCGNIENNFYWGIATTKNNSYSAIADGLHTSTYELTITSDMSDETVDGAIPLAIYANFRTLGDVYNNFTVYPMIRRADIIDDTYEPYHESVEVMYEEEIHGVNLLKPFINSQTINGITITRNADESLTLNGTATANVNLNIKNAVDLVPKSGNYILTDGVKHPYIFFYINDYSTGSWVDLTRTNYDNTSFYYDVNAVVDSRVGLYVSNGITVSNLIFKPMLRKADIEDSTYRPYNHQAIQNQLNAQGVLGAKNLLNITSDTQTLNGVTFTFYKDSKGNLLYIDGNGTATANSSLRLTAKDAIDYDLWSGKTLRLTGCQSGGSNNTYALELYYNDGEEHWNRDFGNGVNITLPVNKPTEINPNIMVKSGVTLNHAKFYPMITLASDPDDTYQPYAMTNRELMEDRYYHAGDTVNVSLMNFAGLITNNSKDIRFTIPLMRDLSKITGITFKNTTTVGIRKPGGGYVVDGAISSGYTIAILAKAGNLLSLKLTKTDNSAFDATNNTPLDVAFTGGSSDSIITFS